MKELRPGTSKIGFLVENNVYSLIPTSKLANSDQNTSNFNNRGGLLIKGTGYHVDVENAAFVHRDFEK